MLQHMSLRGIHGLIVQLTKRIAAVPVNIDNHHGLE